MIQEQHKETVHEDADGSNYAFESSGRYKRLVKDDKQHRPPSILASIAKLLLGRP